MSGSSQGVNSGLLNFKSACAHVVSQCLPQFHTAAVSYVRPSPKESFLPLERHTIPNQDYGGGVSLPLVDFNIT